MLKHHYIVLHYKGSGRSDEGPIEVLCRHLLRKPSGKRANVLVEILTEHLQDIRLEPCPLHQPVVLFIPTGQQNEDSESDFENSSA
jgi:hypothetical protein